MSRRGYASSELYEQRERDRDYYPPRDRGGRTVEYDEVDIRERRRTSAREPDFLRDDYGRSAAGPLVIRDDKRDRESEYRPRPRDRTREVEERDIIVSKGPRSERTSDRDINYEREELVYRSREPERPRTREINIERDDIVYQPRPREPEPQQIRRVREDWEYRRPREPEIERETIDIRERERERPRERDTKDEEIIIRRRSRSIERERPREREYKDQEIVIRRSSRSRERERPRQSDFREEDIVIRRNERERERPRERERDRGYEKDEIIIRRDEGNRPRTRASSFDRETIKLRVDEKEPRRARSRADFREEDITIRREERERPTRDFREEDLIIRRRDASRETRRTMRSRSRSRSRDREDITIRHDDRGGRHRDEIIIRRDEKSPSPEPVYAPPLPPPEPEPIRAPPIHQEIITHHRHIDHGKSMSALKLVPQRLSQLQPQLLHGQDRHHHKRAHTTKSKSAATHPATDVTMTKISSSPSVNANVMVVVGAARKTTLPAAAVRPVSTTPALVQPTVPEMNWTSPKKLITTIHALQNVPIWAKATTEPTKTGLLWTSRPELNECRWKA
ncbi:MAG: hypothetical protein L6R41_006098 [Letrouitia leprolyta]|nr:MAG: hypothetical protein L6R41_006098 [Letrouitia leprolyta]